MCVWSERICKEKQRRVTWRDRGASPVNSRTSTLCLLVDTVTGTQEEPDGKEKDMGGRECNTTCHSLEGKVNWVKCYMPCPTARGECLIDDIGLFMCYSWRQTDGGIFLRNRFEVKGGLTPPLHFNPAGLRSIQPYVCLIAR